jgi:hypothetical protein
MKPNGSQGSSTTEIVVCLLYQLFYGDRKIGEVEVTSGEFPTAHGIFQPCEIAETDPLRSHIQNYINFSMQAATIGEEDDYGERWEDFQIAGERDYLDLIDSEAWYLLDASGTKTSITVPVFHGDREISWR